MFKRPVCLATVFLVIGMIVELYLQISIAFLAVFGLLIGALLFKKFKQVAIFIYIGILILGMLLIHIVDNNYEREYKNLLNQELNEIKAIVVSDGKEKQYQYVYEIEIREINGSTKSKGAKCLLNVKKGKIASLDYGACISFNGKFEIPSGARNYRGFDYQKYLKSKKIYGNVVAKNNIKVISYHNCSWFCNIVHIVRNSITNKIKQLLPENICGVCIGILTGEKENISEEIIDSFQESNLTHMLAVSGTHISYVILGISILFSKVHKRIKKIFIIVFLIFFMSLTNFTPSVQRATIMYILTLISGLVYRKPDIYTNLGLSAFVILLCNPYAILDIGFQLSYGGTIGIVILHPQISKCCKKVFHIKNTKRTDQWNVKLIRYIVNLLTVTISANLILIPIMLFRFHTISFNFWISNLLASPLLGFIIILGFIVYASSTVYIEIAGILAIPLKYSLKLLIEITEFCSSLPLSSVIVRSPYVLEILIYYGMVYGLVFHYSDLKEYVQYIKRFLIKNIKRRELGNRLISLVLIFTMIISCIFGLKVNQSLKIYFVDVGQGDCMLICTPKGKNILVDGGGSDSSSFDVGEKVLLPYLLNRKIMAIDYMMISHFDSDHVGRITNYYGENKSQKSDN